MNINRKITTIFIIAITVITAMLALGCGSTAPRLSFNVEQRFNAARFTAVALATGSAAVLPLLTHDGAVLQTPVEFHPDSIYANLATRRPDLNFASHSQFENAFPPRFDRRQFPVFYEHLFNGDESAVANLDSIWYFIAQDFLLVHSVRDGAAITSANGKYFKHVSVVSEIWGRDTRRVMRRVSCRGVTDDREITEGDLISECFERLTRTLPAAAPTTLGEPGATSSRRAK